MFFSFVIAVVTLVANYKIYEKMGIEGWKAIIPFYSSYVLFEALYGSGWKFLFLLIPFFNIYIYIRMNIDLAKAFNKDGGFAVGLILLPVVFSCILGFGDARYNGQKFVLL